MAAGRQCNDLIAPIHGFWAMWIWTYGKPGKSTTLPIRSCRPVTQSHRRGSNRPLVTEPSGIKVVIVPVMEVGINDSCGVDNDLGSGSGTANTQRTAKAEGTFLVTHFF